MSYVDVAGHQLEYRRIGGAAGRPTLVFLHEGLGCAAMWRDFPDRLAAATGCSALIYSRHGYGGSDVLQVPRQPDYMHREAREVLPAVLAALGIEDHICIGHSDGGSIALIHAATGPRGLRAIVVEAPHVLVEDITVAAIERARETFATTDMGTRLGRFHADPAATFRGWNDIWLHPAFRDWDIRALLADVRCPILAVQGEQDPYGTMAQIDTIARMAPGPVECLKLPDCRHTPHQDRADLTLPAMAAFIGRH